MQEILMVGIAQHRALRVPTEYFENGNVTFFHIGSRINSQEKSFFRGLEQLGVKNYRSPGDNLAMLIGF
ncbi:MAG: hypothetical protein WBM91_05640 [Eudoraea sp.]|uniref:hypothetical protein n=1 Tax=Eudoraea sp. TaxID=1979955 RepID=UPI003C7853C4